jgi:hypothetical protein
MAKPLADIERDALMLPTEDRAALAEHQLAALSDAVDPEVERAWVAEAQRRYKAYREGRITARPAEEALAEFREKLAGRDKQPRDGSQHQPPARKH